MRITKGSRIALIAASGGGKTTASQAILVRLHDIWQADPMYVLDNKPSRSFNTWWHLKGVTRWSKDSDPPLLKRGILIWRPKDPDIVEAYNAFFKKILLAGKPCIIYIDELALTNGERERGGYPAYLGKLLKEGREKDITIIIGSQEAAYVPRQLLGQTNYVITGHLNQLADKAKMAEIYGFGKTSDAWKIRHEHGLWVLDQSKPIDVSPPSYYENIQELLGAR